MSKIPLKNCTSVFLDTGILIDLLKIDTSSCSEDVVKRIELTKMLIESINGFFNTSKKSRYLISSINIAEIFHIDNLQDETIDAVISVLKTEQIEVYSFDVRNAYYHNKEYYSSLNKKSIDELKKKANYPLSMHVSIEDRIRKDMLIASTAQLYKADLILTNDGGFKTICDHFKLYCHCVTNDDSQYLMSGDGKIIYDIR